MTTGQIIMLVVLVIMIGILVALYFVGKRMQKRQDEQKEQIEQYKQTVNMLIIDKKRLKVKDSGLPQQVMDQTPWYLRGSKLPIVKAKIGPQIVTLVSEEGIFESIPVKKEVKATISGIYITAVRGVHGTVLNQPVQKKKNWYRRTVEKLQEKAGAKPLK